MRSGKGNQEVNRLELRQHWVGTPEEPWTRTITLFLGNTAVCQGPTLPSLQPTGGNEAQGPLFGGKTMDFNAGTGGKVQARPLRSAATARGEAHTAQDK